MTSTELPCPAWVSSSCADHHMTGKIRLLTSLQTFFFPISFYWNESILCPFSFWCYTSCQPSFSGFHPRLWCWQNWAASKSRLIIAQTDWGDEIALIITSSSSFCLQCSCTVTGLSLSTTPSDAPTSPPFSKLMCGCRAIDKCF